MRTTSVFANTLDFIMDSAAAQFHILTRFQARSPTLSLSEGRIKDRDWASTIPERLYSSLSACPPRSFKRLLRIFRNTYTIAISSRGVA